MQQDDSDSPPRAPPIKYTAPLGTRWAKEKAAAGGAAAFDLPTDPRNIGPWVLGECIGKGASGRVKIARHRRTRQLAAVKILPITPLVNSRASLATQQAKSEKQRLGIDREITMMKLMNHPNIMRIYDVYEGEKELFLVLEYVEGGELFDFLVNRGRLPPSEALLYFRQIIYGLNYAHTFSIIHRDLKPENILIASLDPPIIKIADWGMAAFAPPSLQLETSCGSPHYASPEIVNGEKYSGTATDIWSCGVILFALLTGRLPFDDKNVRTLLSKVKSGKYDMPAWIDPLARDLLTRMLVVDVRKRISIPEIIAHPWFNKLSPSNSLSSPLNQNNPALNPVLPPSPSILARPISSASLIDPDLFNSLRVIWGRHAEAQTALIQRDLCSPAGQGTYAKAFYFLLDRYREDTMRSRSDDADDQYQSIGSDAEAPNSSKMVFYNAPETPDSYNPSTAPPGLTLAEPQHGSTLASISHTSNRVSEDIGYPTGAMHPNSASGSNSSANRQQPLSPARPGPSTSSRNTMHSSGQHSSRTTHSSRKSYHQPSTSEMRRATGPPMSPAPRPQTSQRSASTDVSAGAGGYGSPSTHLPLRSPSPMYPSTQAQVHSRMSSSSAMDVDGRSIHRGAGANQHHRRESVRAPSHILERVDGAIHAANRASMVQSMMAAVDAMGDDMDVDTTRQGTQDFQDGARFGRGRYNMDKENVPSHDGWTHIEVVDGQSPSSKSAKKEGSSHRESLIPIRGKKEKERKSRPPPLELSNHTNFSNQRRTILGTPLHKVTSTIGQSPLPPPPPPSAATNRIMASPVVGEFRGWFSNLFSWKTNSSSSNGTNQPSIFYSMEDGLQTRDLAFAMVQSMGFGITRIGAPSHVASGELQIAGDGGNASSSGGGVIETYQCRLDTFVSDPQTAMVLKPTRFRIEFYFLNLNTMAPGVFPPPSPAPMAFGGAGYGHGEFGVPSNGYLSATTPVPQAGGGGGFTFRPRHSLMIGVGGGDRRTSAASGTGSGASTPTAAGGGGGGGAGAGGSMDLPPGCSCVITLVHEKGSTGTFRTMRQRLRDVFDARGMNLASCFSPVMPATPFAENGQGQGQGVRVG